MLLQILIKIPNIQYDVNSPVGAALIHADRRIDGQTDRQMEGRKDERTNSLRAYGFLERFNVTGKNRQYLGHYVRGLTFLPSFNQI